jgi:hypothetical protein
MHSRPIYSGRKRREAGPPKRAVFRVLGWEAGLRAERIDSGAGAFHVEPCSLAVWSEVTERFDTLIQDENRDPSHPCRPQT